MTQSPYKTDRGCGALVRTLHEQHVRTQSDFEMGARRSRIFVSEVSARSYLDIRRRPYDDGDGRPELISVVRRMLIPRRRSSLHSRAVTCLRFWRLRVNRSSCSILTEDEAVGHMEKNAEGKMAITRVELRPFRTFSDSLYARARG